MKLLSFGKRYYEKSCSCGCGTCDEAKKLAPVVTVGALPPDPERVRRPSTGVGIGIAIAAAAGFSYIISKR